MSAAAAIAEAIVGGLTAAGKLLASEREENLRTALASMHGPLPDLALTYREEIAKREQIEALKAALKPKTKTEPEDDGA